MTNIFLPCSGNFPKLKQLPSNSTEMLNFPDRISDIQPEQQSDVPPSEQTSHQSPGEITIDM